MNYTSALATEKQKIRRKAQKRGFALGFVIGWISGSLFLLIVLWFDQYLPF